MKDSLILGNARFSLDPDPAKQTMADAIREVSTAVRIDPETGDAVPVSKEAKDIGSTICGDCAKVFPCQHGDGSKTFGN